MPKAKRPRYQNPPRYKNPWAPDDLFSRFFGRRPFMPESESEATAPTLPANPLEIQMLTEMLKAGYKALAMKYHPDHEGGDAQKMTELNRLKKELGL